MNIKLFFLIIIPIVLPWIADGYVDALGEKEEMNMDQKVSICEIKEKRSMAAVIFSNDNISRRKVRVGKKQFLLDQIKSFEYATKCCAIRFRRKQHVRCRAIRPFSDE